MIKKLLFSIAFYATLCACEESEPTTRVPDLSAPTGWTAYSIDVPEDYGIWAINFIDDKMGWMASSRRNENPPVLIDRHLYQTSDGGNSWELINTDDNIWASNGISQMHFFDKYNGVFTGRYESSLGQIWYQTENGGQSIQPMGDSGAMFSNGQKVWHIRHDGLYSSVDGKDWELLHEGIVGTSVYFVDDLIGYSDLLYTTTDGGKTWEEPNFSLPFLDSNVNFSTIVFDTPLHGYAVKYRWRLLETTDGGRNWTYAFDDITRQDFSKSFSIVDMHISSVDGTIYMAGQGSYYSKSANQDWVKHEMGKNVHIYDIYEAPNGNIWMVGMDGVIFKKD